ncbi:unnamed protein product [Lactuca saligna]|uniref:Uncharacterized protein n=1 Tax=Lactuca saligna TaxID=75948 RepID=A0AA35ZN56_LACSI|nr:unnamed protein product [Lactuca saligna]
MVEGLEANLYNHFVGLLWGNGDSAYLSKLDFPVDTEWESFCAIILDISGRDWKNPQIHSGSSWEFLVNSSFHEKYSKSHFMSGFSRRISLQSDQSCIASQHLDTSHTVESLLEIIDLLHAVYESLKLNHLRKSYLVYPFYFKDLGHLVALLLKAAQKFLKDGDKVKLIVKLKGRESELKNNVIDLIRCFRDDVGEVKLMEERNMKPLDSNLATLSARCSKDLELNLAKSFLSEMGQCTTAYPYNQLLGALVLKNYERQHATLLSWNLMYGVD